MNLTNYIPESLRVMGPWDIAYWQWLGLGITVLLTVVVGRILTRIASWMISRFVGRTETQVDDMLLERLASPIRLIGSVACARVIVPILDLPPSGDDAVKQILLAVLAFAIVLGLLRGIDVLTSTFATANWAKQRPASIALISLLGRIAKVVVVVIAVIALLGSLGLPVTSLLAGLGIGGIALAFGAQKTVENLFGAVAIGIDQPLREGDFVLIDSSVLGTVETVGLRSSRIRTLDRTVVSLPNGRLADMKIETFAPRDRCRLVTTIGLAYGTTAAQITEILAAFERILRAHPKTWPDTVVVRFAGFGASSLDIEIMAWFITNDYNVFRDCRQDCMLEFMHAVERAGAKFAIPTSKVFVAEPVVVSPLKL